ncbi:hypothetical protein [Streptomyces sp. JJ38]|uniref:hypothetical protein n=1 Tax=Streptomyces sp. JJ38 TaxID=2738128 RepID=UPI00214C534D|nr:hypothetical protein [Streptomyces sp. JJ38]
MRLHADADGSRWTGRQRVSFRNASDQPLHEGYLRLWGNGEDTCGPPGAQPPVRVSKVRGGIAGPLTVDCTAPAITPPEPLSGGEQASVTFDVSIAVPERNARFGREGAFRFLGNALPVLAVRDGKEWHPDPYASRGESFYALASDFRVRLDHPTALKAPATGQTWTRPGPPGRTVTWSVADQVRHFAWASGPFRTASDVSPGGVRVASYRAPGTPADGVRQNREEGVAAVDHFSEAYGRSPYGELGLVMTPGFNGGMEYPGLVLTSSSATPATTGTASPRPPTSNRPPRP